MKKIILGVWILFVACSSDNEVENPALCTLEARPGLEIIVTDAENGESLIEGVTITIADGSYSETLNNQTETKFFYGAYEREGTYIITITKTGYVSISSDPVIVTKDVCHVITKKLEFVLLKE